MRHNKRQLSIKSFKFSEKTFGGWDLKSSQSPEVISQSKAALANRGGEEGPVNDRRVIISHPLLRSRLRNPGATSLSAQEWATRR